MNPLSTKMNTNGFFPVHPCKQCGETLSGENGPRPAETYAGTYTGICYRCQNSGPYPIGEPLPDGTVKLSYPPSCPSWRRDRQEFWGHPDCADCNGAGFRWDSTHYPIYHTWRAYCQTCHSRVWDVRRSNELDYISAVRDLLDASDVTGDPIESCKQAAISATDQAFTIYAGELEPYRPHKRTSLATIEYGLKPTDLKVKRASTLLARFVRALDVEISKRAEKDRARRSQLD